MLNDIDAYNLAKSINGNIDNDEIFNMYAGWSANTYYITFDLNDCNGLNNINEPGRDASSQATFVNGDENIQGKTAIVFDDPATYVGHASRPGYTFAGWGLHYKGLAEDKLTPFSSFDTITNPDGTTYANLYDFKHPTNYVVDLDLSKIYRINRDTGEIDKSKLLLYQIYDKDLDIYCETNNSLYEEYGDLEPVANRNIVLIAKWVARTYGIIFDSNDSASTDANGSTKAEKDFFKKDNADLAEDFAEGYYFDEKNFRIVFDTRDWYYSINGTEKFADENLANNTYIPRYLEQLAKDRYGYTFMGWATKQYKNGETVDPSTVVFDRFGYYRREDYKEDDVIDTLLYNLTSSNIDDDLINGEDAYNPDKKLDVTLYALWVQNVYTVKFFYNDYQQGKMNMKKHGAADSEYHELHKTVGYSFWIGSSNVKKKISQKVTLKFDDDNGITLNKLSRNGYDFYGYKFGTNSLDVDFTVDNDTLFTSTSDFIKITLNNSTISTTSNGVVIDNYLYENGEREFTNTVDGARNGDLDELAFSHDTPNANKTYTYGAASRHSVYLYALWTPITYKVTLNLNDVNDGTGSSTAYYKQQDEQKFVGNDINTTYKVSVEFDTNKWEYVRNDTNDPLKAKGLLGKIEVGRIGYEWVGWYAKTGTNNNDGTHVYKAGTGDDLNTLTLFEHFKSKFYTYFDTIDDTKAELTIYARWKAKTYTIDIDVNEHTDDSSKAMFKNIDGNLVYNITDAEYKELVKTNDNYKVEVVFDHTNSWDNLENIVIDRYGFRWIGLFAKTIDSTKIRNSLNENSKNAIIAEGEGKIILDIDLYMEIIGREGAYEYLIINEGLDKKRNTDGVIDEVNGEYRLLLHARWEANTYTVNLSYYDAKTGHGSTYVDKVEWQNGIENNYTQKIKFGSTFEFNGEFARTGYQFIGFVVGTNQQEALIREYREFYDADPGLDNYLIRRANGAETIYQNRLTFTYLNDLRLNFKAYPEDQMDTYPYKDPFIYYESKVTEPAEGEGTETPTQPVTQYEKYGDTEFGPNGLGDPANAEHHIYIYAYYHAHVYTLVLNKNFLLRTNV